MWRNGSVSACGRTQISDEQMDRRLGRPVTYHADILVVAQCFSVCSLRTVHNKPKLVEWCIARHISCLSLLHAIWLHVWIPMLSFNLLAIECSCLAAWLYRSPLCTWHSLTCAATTTSF
jgi:hypothetical protein